MVKSSIEPLSSRADLRQHELLNAAARGLLKKALDGFSIDERSPRACMDIHLEGEPCSDIGSSAGSQ
jgi:hypothetical protein